MKKASRPLNVIVGVDCKWNVMCHREHLYDLKDCKMVALPMVLSVIEGGDATDEFVSLNVQ